MKIIKKIYLVFFLFEINFACNSQIKVVNLCSNKIIEIDQDSTIFSDSIPLLNGAYLNLNQFFKDNLNKPNAVTKYKLDVKIPYEITISETGEIIKIQNLVTETSCMECKEEARKTIMKMPKLLPFSIVDSSGNHQYIERKMIFEVPFSYR